MKLRDLIHDIEISKVAGDTDLEILGISYDSRKIEFGHLFAALDGSQIPGDQFIPQAIANGARCILTREKPIQSKLENVTWLLCESPRTAFAAMSRRYFGYPDRNLRLVGITGTNGKTTTTYFIENLLKECLIDCGVIGTIGVKIKERIFPALATTPESSDLMPYFKRMTEAGISYAAMEVSSHSLVLHRVDGLCFDVAIFTNLTQDHLDFHGSMAEYLKAKSKLFEMLKNATPQSTGGIAILNRDDPVSKEILSKLKGFHSAVTYGFEAGADICAIEISLHSDCSDFTIQSSWGNFNVSLPVPGRHNIANCLAAFGSVIALGCDPESAADAISKIQPVAGRMHLVRHKQPFTIIIDYAHTPDALKNLLASLRPLTKGRLITVFGCGGDRDRMKRPIMGEEASRVSDLTIVTSDNPRTEDPHKIIDDILPGIITGREYRILPNRHEAIDKAIAIAQTGDCIVIAGKGHEDYQIIGRSKIHLDDHEEAVNSLKSRGFCQ